MLPDEQVQAVVFQPAIWQRRWLAVTLRWRGVEESWRALFQPSAEPALRALVEQAGI